MQANSISVDPTGLIRALRRSAFYQNQIVETGRAEASEPEWGEPERPILAAVEEALHSTGIDRLYSHQATAFDLADAGKDLVVTSGTGSGKTLCYNLPVLQRLMQEPAGRALYLYPTKALAQDQLGKLEELAPQGVRVSTYDGDTPRGRRPAIRKNAHIVLTNPDMLHLGILPNHTSWARFLRNLRFLILDEMHAYSGVFGSHVALVVRRLLRLCEWLGSRPQIIACSATIRNPADLFEALTGRKGELVDRDGAPSGRRYLLMWNPPMIDEEQRRSAMTETSRIVESLARGGARTLAFSRSRVGAELVLSYTRGYLQEGAPGLADRIESYRAGYTPEDRRRIEKRLFSGELLGLSSTNAMELGVDIGSLDAVVMNGYPGSISSLRQQSGRAGRGARDGLAILVAHDDPLEQYLVKHPDLLMFGKAEAVRVRPSNPHILTAQLRCAAHERPIAPHELERFPPNAIEVLEEMEEGGLIERRAGLWFHPSHGSPAADVDIRGAQRQYVIECDGEVIGSMEEWRAYQWGHEGAIYLHRGEQYLVTCLDFDGLRVVVEPVQVDYYTQSLTDTSVWPTAEAEKRALGSGEIRYMGLRVTATVTAFRRTSLPSNAVLSVEPLDMPSYTIETLGLRIDLPAAPSAEQQQQWTDGVHALEHLMVALAPLIAQCDPRDLGSAYYGVWPDTGRPAIYVYDSAPGGSGISEELFARTMEWLGHVREQLESCSCKDGCPACIFTPRCPYGNEGLDKSSGSRVLRRLLVP
ncbi:MAG: DEAD/DEAH box helicase [Armatimonadetes bacterium]|nr:DEAD/DEAH box helicase [Armatimonadota bacterium]